MKSAIKSAVVNRLHDRKGLFSTLYTLLAIFLSVFYLELLLHFAAFGTPKTNLLFVAGFSFVFSCVLTVILAAVPVKFRFCGVLFTEALLAVLYGSQMVYYFVFGSLYSVSQVQMGGAAITSFWKELLETMSLNIPWLLGLFVPIGIAVILKRVHPFIFSSVNSIWCACLLCAGLFLHILTVQCLSIGGTGYFTNYYFYHNDSTTTDQATQRFGLLTAFRLDMFGAEAPAEAHGEEIENSIPVTTAPVTPVPDTTENDAQETQPAKVIEYNILDIDFDQLNTLTESKKIQQINNYCKTLTGTSKNEYTGLLKDYNLIVLCAESFSSAVIDPELTPTLYRLANEGFVFTNYYATYPNNTTDGEYTLCTGLYPDFSRGKSASSFYASRNSYLPFCLGNIFQEQRGISSYGYHNYLGSYYGRDESHPNMGYTMKFSGDGMRFTSAWPSSDLEMMEQSVDDYLSADQQFHAYYMTFSGHMSYSRSLNSIADRNYDAVSHLDMDETAKCYLSCNIELDKALEYLMQRLEEAGVADKTAIVLAADHYPYGLSDKQYEQLAGKSENDFSRYKSTLIFWVGGMEEPVIVDEYCCSADILPTILNLWGFKFDSRLLAGTDILSDGPHVAVLRDMSFLTDQVWLNGSTGEITYLVDESQLAAGYIENMVEFIKAKFTLSANILNTAYYNFIFEQGKVTINRDGWYDEPEQQPPAETDAPSPPEETVPAQTIPPETTEPPPAQTSPAPPPETVPSETVPPVQPTVPEPPVETTSPTEVPSPEETTPSVPAESTPGPETEPNSPPEASIPTTVPESTDPPETVPESTEPPETAETPTTSPTI